VILAAYCLDFTASEAVVVRRLPHAAGMGLRGRDRHRHGDKRPCQQEHKQQSGGQAIHEFRRDKHKGRGLRTQVLLWARSSLLVRQLGVFRLCFTTARAGRSRPHWAATYFISTQRPPPVNMITRFITTNIRS
jgi:hypothetical protein